MVIVAKTNVMAVGAGKWLASINELPIRLINLKNGLEAVRSFKTEQVDSVISHWHLDDMPDGMFLKRLRAMRPYMPTIAIVEPKNPQQEIAARSLGVAAVIPDDCSEEHFREIVSAVLHLSPESVEHLYAVKEY
jgi:DNA-binding NarL/FixJ family response regulator